MYIRPYILGYPCTVFTDHAACPSLLGLQCPSGELVRWAMTIQEMDLVIKHCAGKRNANADALSSIPDEPHFAEEPHSLDCNSPG